ncbi:uncharacterized protein F5Z01DRAFT_631874 [Emericellopsis atlantica]|uniref:Uncharacterized protein n=1 Tax=Emericellopsis atlantica TaxID=2614577 RepID=A0A9P8CTX4_9HYPO|nr:uncharacterized protein F5Z01DRAFT_631874 [Emericellopsis atlantica]KAG9258777.1 hypothetical protein F5Z01DRAFT_631874 [Emericellopsis atlantica]
MTSARIDPVRERLLGESISELCRLIAKPIPEAKLTSFNGDISDRIITPLNALSNHLIREDERSSESGKLSKNIIAPECECAVCEMSWLSTWRQTTTDVSQDEARQQRTQGKTESYAKANYMSVVTNLDDATARLTELLELTQGMKEALRLVLEQHGNAVYRAWFRNEKKRRAITEQACPTLYPYSRPPAHVAVGPEELRTYLSSLINIRAPVPEIFSPMLLPWLDTESLVEEPHRLIALLHARTAHGPQEWFAHDFQQTDVTWRHWTTPFVYAPFYVSVKAGSFGEVMFCGLEEAHALGIIGYPRARAVLEAQYVLMRYLSQLVVHMLATASTSELKNHRGTDDLLKEAKLQFKQAGSVTLGSPHYYQAFRSPAHVDFSALYLDACARLEEASSHFERLQPRPAKMAELIEGEIHTYLIMVQICNVLYRLCDIVAPSTTTFTAEVVADIVHLGGLVRLYIQLCSSSVVADMRIENVFLGNNPQPQVKRTNRRGQCPAHMLEYEPLYWCVSSMLRAPHDGYKVDYTFLFTMFEELMNVPENRAKRFVSPQLHRTISSMAGAHEIAISLERMRPYVAYDFAGAQISKNRRFDFDDSHSGWSLNDERRGPGKCLCCNEPAGSRDRLVAIHAEFLEPFELLTLPQRSNPSAWLAYHEKSHELLGTLWTNLREHFFENDALFLRGVVSDADFDFLDHHAQADHVKLLRLERAALEMQIKTETERKVVHIPRSSTHVFGRNKMPVRKSKTKTRTDAELDEELRKMVFNLTLDTDHEAEEDEKLHTVDHVEVAKIKTTRRAYDLIRHLYPTTAEESGRTYPWDKFVAAMGDLRFTATNCGGSAWPFPSSSRWVGNRSHLNNWTWYDFGETNYARTTVHDWTPMGFLFGDGVVDWKKKPATYKVLGACSPFNNPSAPSTTSVTYSNGHVHFHVHILDEVLDSEDADRTRLSPPACSSPTIEPAKGYTYYSIVSS